ncbi:MAG: hypothetical protein DMG88_04185 [Acidobacteria bacterium]|nr:MAG: hypothetical protein DMG88_04185 [Acidobacteriota bacterium]
MAGNANRSVTFSVRAASHELDLTKLNKQAQIPEGKHVEISCREVIRELSKYIDQDLDTDLRVQIEAHLADCKHCTAIYDGIRNVITLMGDDRSFDLPAGFSQRFRNSITRTCR